MQRKPKSYSAALMDQIPIKYLVTQAQGLQQELGGKIVGYQHALENTVPKLAITSKT